MPGIDELRSLSPEQRELLLDLGQFTLDIVGIFEPTPFADLTNGVISIIRGDYTGAALSGVSMIPYVGDLAKLGKIPKYLDVVRKAIDVARADRKFAELLQPILRKLRWALEQLPLDKLPANVREAAERMHRMIGEFLPGGARSVSRLDHLTDEMLRRVLGSTSNVGLLPRQNVRTVVAFFDKYQVAKGNLDDWAKLFKGIDLHAAEPISVVNFRPGDMVAQYIETVTPDRIGQWMVKVQGAVSHRNIGLSGAGRERKVFRVKQDVEVLKSTAAPAADYWTKAGGKPHIAPLRNGGTVGIPAEQVAGGGEQFFLPQAWNLLEEIKVPVGK